MLYDLLDGLDIITPTQALSNLLKIPVERICNNVQLMTLALAVSLGICSSYT